MRSLLLLVALGSGPVIGAPSRDPWADEARLGARAEKTPPPRMLERRDMIDELQVTLGEWQSEAREWANAQGDYERARFERVDAETEAEAEDGAGDDASEEEEEEAAEAAPEPASGDAAREPASSSDRDWVERQLREFEAKQSGEVAAQAEQNPEDVEWERAAERKRHARAEAIEAEARRIQDELNAARRREAEAQAKQLGGSLDAEGNFVDPDLEGEK
jgi:hypothetical protein